MLSLSSRLTEETAPKLKTHLTPQRTERFQAAVRVLADLDSVRRKERKRNPQKTLVRAQPGQLAAQEHEHSPAFWVDASFLLHLKTSFLSQGAFWGLVTGLLLGVVRLVLDFIYPEPRCDEPDLRPGVVKYMHYLYFSMVLATVSTLTVLVVSLLTEPPSEEMVRPHFRFLLAFQAAPTLQLRECRGDTEAGSGGFHSFLICGHL